MFNNKKNIDDFPYYKNSKKKKKSILPKGKRVFFDSKNNSDEDILKYSFISKKQKKSISEEFLQNKKKKKFKSISFPSLKLDYTKITLAVLMISLFIVSLFIAVQKLNAVELTDRAVTEVITEEEKNLDKIEVNNKEITINYNRVKPQNRSLLSPRDITNTYFSVGGEESILTPVKYIDYTVKKGDTFWDLAKKFKISVDTIYSANKTNNPHFIRIGKKIKIPSQTGLVANVKSVNDVEKYMNKYDIDKLSILISNGASSLDQIANSNEVFLPSVELAYSEKMKTYGIDFKKPTYGYITSRYGYRLDPFNRTRRFHSGLDIANRTGTRIRASYHGVVIFAGRNGGYGNCIIIKHALGYTTLYGHMSRLAVRKGQYVSKGQIIGYMGSTGRSTGSHLHFEIRRFGKTYNPSLYLRS